MRRLAFLLLAWPLVADAAAPVAKIQGEKSITVLKGSTFALDARNSVSDEDLVWDFEKGFDVELLTPTNGKKGSILVVKAELPARKYRFTVIAKEKQVQVQKSSHDHVDVTIVESSGTTSGPGNSTPVGTPIARIQGPAVVTPGSSLVLDARASHFDRRETVDWTVDSNIGYELIGSADAPSSVLLIKSIPAGGYVFTMMVRGTPAADGNSKTDVKRHVVTAEAATSNSNSPRAESPLPTPIEMADQLIVSAVVEPEHQLLGEKVGLAGYDVRRSEELFNFRYNTYDKTSRAFANTKLRPYIDGCLDQFGKVWPKIEGAAIIIQDKSGRVISVERAPRNGAGVIAKIVEHRLR